jgi:hypothetical protein
MLGLNFNINTLLIIAILGYVLYLIIINNFDSSINRNLNEGFVNLENDKRPPPNANDDYATNYKSILTTNVEDICDRKTKSYCLPFELNKVPEQPVLEPPENGEENFKGKNFLFAGHHSQVDNVGVSKTNRKNQFRPEPVNPQVGVNPSSQSTINFDWTKDDQVLNMENIKYENLIEDAWNSIS